MRFGPLLALDDVSFAIEKGRVHAILGENGAGKSTLMKILAGEVRPSNGSIQINNESRIFHSPREAKRAGIRYVHQHLSLIPALTIAENFVLESSSGARSLDLSEVSDKLRESALGFGLDIDPDRRVSELSMSERQWLEVFRAIFLGADTLILDEPTALLSPIEGDRLLSRVRDIAQSGKTVILITHKLREIVEFADVVTVLRKGSAVGTFPMGQMSPEKLSSLMIGNDSDLPAISFSDSPFKDGTAIVEARALSALDSRRVKVLSKVDISIMRGEIHGVAGVAGNGQTELVEILAGLRPLSEGAIRFPTLDTPRIRYVPAARTTEAIASSLSILENLALRDYHSDSKRGVINWATLRKLGERMVKDFQIKIGSVDDSPFTLSGGNMQRVVLAREMEGDTHILIVHNPTSGIDLPSSLFVRTRLREAAMAGVGVLMVSDDLDELMQTADRISVLHSGRVAGVLPRAEFSRDRIGQMMVGHVSATKTSA